MSQERRRAKKLSEEIFPNEEFQNFVSEVDPDSTLSADAEKLVQQIVLDCISGVTSDAIGVAKLRGARQVESSDIDFVLSEHNHPFEPNSRHKARLTAAINSLENKDPKLA